MDQRPESNVGKQWQGRSFKHGFNPQMGWSSLEMKLIYQNLHIKMASLNMEFIFSHRTRVWPVWLKMSGTHQKPMNDHHCPHSMAISGRIPNFQTHPNGILWQSSMPEYIYIYMYIYIIDYITVYILFFLNTGFPTARVDFRRVELRNSDVKDRQRNCRPI